MNAWQPIETAPNDVFDVIAKYWDAGLDKFLLRRITDCVKVDDEICASDWSGNGKRLAEMGYRATHWMPIPEPPENT